jgi:AraC-like DNA-binding protein
MGADLQITAVPAGALAVPPAWLPRPVRLAAVQAYVESNLEWGVLTPVTTARALGISVRQLHLLFQPTGKTFARYVLARRLERVRVTLLQQPARKVLDVAFAWGIESSTVFYRGFRQAFGMTPTAYRRAWLAGGRTEGACAVAQS